MDLTKDIYHHNHAPEASKPEALKACIRMKELAKISNDQPAQIISNVIAATSREIQLCLPRKDALRQQIKRAKRVCDEEVEPMYITRCILYYTQWNAIHAPAGGNVNFRITPLVYALMSKKTEELYPRLFQELNELADENELELKPDFVLTDFEKGSINAVK
ncbi:unnamed protein product [Didymodactylos carnosus]|uniref:MULE transposase domain-containing protein n=1 Tax=Didymodactylos carnosus TaxID=1234261 RepID=A0A815UP95_9BILA|nr:unnamed protein product [Didymodactylos carnosus]CAF4376392.1 unnamed protein product [Didymodactylos carnosus]